MLHKIVGKFVYRMDGLINEADILAVKSLDPSTRRQAEHLIFQMQNSWENFVREYILCSATGKYYNRGGLVYSTLSQPIHSKENASYILISLYPRRTKEPNWYLSQDAIDAAQRLQLSNFAKISAVLGSTPWPPNDLRLIRNFFAHRSKSSAIEVRSLSWYRYGATIEVENTAFDFVTGGLTRFAAWGHFMKRASVNLL